MGRKHLATAVTGPILLLILLVLVLIPAGCIKSPAETGAADQTPVPVSQEPQPRPEPGQGEQTQGKQTVDPATVEKYYDYFAASRHPIFNFNSEVDDEILDDNLMFFAILNLPNYSYEQGNTKEEIDAVLIKYFGRTVNNYVTAFSEYVPGTDRIRATGWDFHGGNCLVLTELKEEDDGSLTGRFDVYHVPEMYFEDHPGDWEHLKQSLLSGDPGEYAELLTYKAIINFHEITEPGGGFYLKYNNIEVFELPEHLDG